jgi:hypothetical protein
VRSALVTALAAAADSSQRNHARKFLQGLSGDELQYIADFLGACILEASGNCLCSRSHLADRITEFQQARGICPLTAQSASDQDHKMILVLEYLGRSGLRQGSGTQRAAGHA